MIRKRLISDSFDLSSLGLMNSKAIATLTSATCWVPQCVGETVIS